MTDNNRMTARDSSGRVYEWRGGQWVPQQSDPGILGTIAINTGAELTNLGRGAADLAASTVERVDPRVRQFREDLQADRREDNELLSGLREDRPFSSIAGQALPYLATAPVSGSVGGAAALEAGLGGLGLADSLNDRLLNAGIAGGLTLGGGLMAQRVINGIGGAGSRIRARRDGIDPRQLSLDQPGVDSAGAARVEGSVVGSGGKISGVRQTLQNAGKQITGEGIESPADLEALITLRRNQYLLKPGQATGNRAARQLYQSAESNPLTSDITQDALTAPNQQRYNREVLEALGDEGNIRGGVAEFSDGQLERIAADVGEFRESIEKAAPNVTIRPDDIENIRRTMREFTSDIGVLSKEDPVLRRINNVLTRLGDEGGTIKTEDLVKIRSSLKDLADTSKRSAESQAFQNVASALDTAFEETLKGIGKGELFKDFRLANQRFRLINALKKPGVRSPEGDIRPAALARNLEKIFVDEYGANKFGGLRESGQGGLNIERLFAITKALKRFPDVAGRSGTAENLSLGNIFNDPIATAGQLSLRPVLRRLIEQQQVDPEVLESLLDIVSSQ